MARVAIITGATGGLGKEFMRFVSNDRSIDEIWAVGRNKDKLDELKKEYAGLVPVIADISLDGTDIIRKKLKEEKPEVRLLVNNAGVAYMGSYEEMGSDKVRNFCEINCTGVAVLISEVLGYMHEGSGIINVSSASSFQPNPYLALYSASKVFVKNLSRALFKELKPRKINVTAVCPGWVDTEMLPRERNGKKIRYTGMISAEKVVNTALKDNRNGKDISTPGFFSKYFRLYSKVTPTRLVMWQWEKMIGKYLK